MAVEKDEVNIAFKLLQNADRALGELVGKIKESRDRAIECKRKATAHEVASADASIDHHQAAALSAAVEYSKFEGERQYWAQLHSKLMAHLSPTRAAVVGAEKSCTQIVEKFWSDRFEEQSAAFFRANKGVLSDLYGALAQFGGGVPTIDHFWRVLLRGAPGTEEYMGGVSAAAIMLPSAPSPMHLSEVSVHGDTVHVGRMVGDDVLSELREQIQALTRIDVANRRRLAEAEQALFDIDHIPQGARRPTPEHVARVKQIISNTRAAIEYAPTRFAEMKAEIVEVETAMAKLDAVRVS